MRHNNEMQTNAAAIADFSEFCERHHARLVGLLGLFCGSRELGEEFAQETFMRAYRDWTKVRTMDAPAAWLYRVGTNLARSHFRRSQAERRARGRLESRPPERTTPEPAIATEMREVLLDLPLRMRTAVVLRYYGQLRLSEIADAMNCSESTVKKILRRALVRLKDQEQIVNGRESWDVS